MLFHVQPTVIDAAIAGSGNFSALVRVENILRAHREGKHIVHLDSDSGSRLLKSGTLSAIESGTLRSIISRRPEIGGLKNQLSYYMEIHHASHGDPIVEQRGKQTVIKTPSAWFDDSSMSQPAVLLTENQTDATLLERLTYALLALKGYRGLRLSLEPRGGGGSTISKEQEALQAQARISLCVVDGDLYCPSGSVGNTAAGLLAVCINCPSFQTHFVISARELENLIPTRLFEAAFSRKGATSLARSLDRLQLLESHVQGEWRLFVDLKEGLRYCDINHYKRNKGAAAWEFIDTLVGHIQANSKTRVPACPNAGQCEDRASCPSIPVPGLGPNALGEVCSYISELSPHQIAQQVEFSNNPLLTKLCEKVSSWFCSYSKMIT